MEIEKTIEPEIKLTLDQETAYEKITSFLKSNERMFVLTGKAGTGKTTLMKYVLSSLLEKDHKMISSKKTDDLFSPNVLGIAMAHKAKNNLQEKGGIPYVHTFASAYAHREKFLDNGNRVFVPMKEKMKYAPCRRPIRVFVFDEVGQFSNEMLNLVLKETTMYSKLIFMGDKGQLPPIVDSGKVDDGRDSPVFEMKIPKNCKHDLVERVRQTKGNPIVDLSDKIYNLIFSNPSWDDLGKLFKLMKKNNLDDGGKGYSTTNYFDIYEKFFSSSVNYLDTKVIAYRNSAVKSFNTELRNYIHESPKEIFIPKEIIYMNKTFYGEDHKGHNFAFYNSSEYIIESVNTGEIDGISVMYAFMDGGKAMPVIDGYASEQVYRERIVEYTKKKDWRSKFAFSDQFGDFSYGYALTAYKAQGATYKNVFVDVNDIVTLEKMLIKRRLQSLYTAITRASDNVYFIGK